MEKVTTFLHFGSVGDVWAAIPAINEYYRKYKKKAILYLKDGQKAFYYQGAVHPTVNINGENVMLNQNMIDMMIPLLEAQESIFAARVWNDEEIHLNLNAFRNTNVGMPSFCISRWQFYTWPDLACDLSKVWLTVPDSDKDLAKGKIIITRTERYTNPNISYKFLRSYEKDILFCGTELEYHIFRLRFGLDIERFHVKNFLELAQALKQCKFHISNQTQAFQLSQGLKIPRILELCEFAPNVIPYGENAFDFFAQESLEYYVSILNGETPKALYKIGLKDDAKSEIIESDHALNNAASSA